MKNNENIKDWYISNFKSFEEKLNGQSESFFHNYRKEALKKFSELEFPTQYSRSSVHSYEPATR